jgi:hypothetical protein
MGSAAGHRQPPGGKHIDIGWELAPSSLAMKADKVLLSNQHLLLVMAC